MQINKDLQKWNDACSIHQHLRNKSRRIGSMENALWRVSDCYMSKSAYLQAITAEFCFGHNKDLELCLHRYYDSFPGAESGKVDVRFLLCTYMCISLAVVVSKNPKRLFSRFCSYFWDSTAGGILRDDILRIISIAAVCDEERENISNRLNISLKETKTPSLNGGKYVTWEMLDCSLDTAPGILLDFRDLIISRLPDKDRLQLIMREEEQSLLAFDKQASKVMLRGAVQLWIHSQYKTFYAWLRYCETRKRLKKNTLWMLCWKGKQYSHHWRTAAIESIVWKKRFAASSSMYLQQKLIDCFSRWLRFVGVQKKIRKSCYALSDEFKGISAGFGYLRSIWCKIKARLYFNLWHFETSFQHKYESACHWHRQQRLRFVFTSLKEFVKRECSKRTREHLASEQQNWLIQLISEVNANVAQLKEENREAHQEANTPKEMMHSKKKALERRKAFAMPTEKQLLAIQQQQRKERIAIEMSNLVSNWEDKWKRLSMVRNAECISRTIKWMNSPDSNSVLHKMLKELQRDFFAPPSVPNRRRENQLNSSTLMYLSILDGNLAYAGTIPDEFFEMLHKRYSKRGAISKNSFKDALNALGVDFHESRITELFDGLCENELSKNGTVIQLEELRKQLLCSYEFHGVRGSPWKQYISPAHQIMLLHNVVNDKVRKRHFPILCNVTS